MTRNTGQQKRGEDVSGLLRSAHEVTRVARTTRKLPHGRRPHGRRHATPTAWEFAPPGALRKCPGGDPKSGARVGYEDAPRPKFGVVEFRVPGSCLERLPIRARTTRDPHVKHLARIADRKDQPWKSSSGRVSERPRSGVPRDFTRLTTCRRRPSTPQGIQLAGPEAPDHLEPCGLLHGEMTKTPE